MLKRKRKPKTARKRLVSELDRQFSLFIRKRDSLQTGGACRFRRELFCAGPIECCFHFITRSKHSVRWDERNAVGSCRGCNFTMEFNPHPYINWYISKYGLVAYEALFRDSNKIAKFENGQLEDMIEVFKNKISSVEKDALTRSDI